nr:unnamed protein product [Digitaria exilis]CAB3504296.1 unnamed protein product [Digitaria exilis]
MRRGVDGAVGASGGVVDVEGTRKGTRSGERSCCCTYHHARSRVSAHLSARSREAGRVRARSRLAALELALGAPLYRYARATAPLLTP